MNVPEMLAQRILIINQLTTGIPYSMEAAVKVAQAAASANADPHSVERVFLSMFCLLEYGRTLDEMVERSLRYSTEGDETEVSLLSTQDKHRPAANA